MTVYPAQPIPSADLAAPGASGPKRRRGMLTFEMMLALPVLLIAVFALVEFSFLLLSYQAVAGSASVGVRQAALPSSDTNDVENAVTASLNGWAFQDDVKVLVYVNGVRDTTNTLLAASTSGDEVSVEVQLLYGKAAPDLLKFVGLSLSEHRLITQYTMYRE